MRACLTRAELFAFVRSLGADPDQTRRIEITPLAVTVTTYLLDEQGRLQATADHEPVLEVSTIPIVGNGDAETVRMRHPNLPGQDIDVRTSGVGQRAMAGWEVVDPYDQDGELSTGVTAEEPTVPEPAVTSRQAPEPPAPDEEPSKTPPRRRKAKEE